MVVNFRIHEISRGTRKLVHIIILNLKKQKRDWNFITLTFCTKRNVATVILTTGTNLLVHDFL